jgi:hypothetical protein
MFTSVAQDSRAKSIVESTSWVGVLPSLKGKDPSPGSPATAGSPPSPRRKGEGGYAMCFQHNLLLGERGSVDLFGRSAGFCFGWRTPQAPSRNRRPQRTGSAPAGGQNYIESACTPNRWGRSLACLVILSTLTYSRIMSRVARPFVFRVVLVRDRALSHGRLGMQV